MRLRPLLLFPRLSFALLAGASVRAQDGPAVVSVNSTRAVEGGAPVTLKFTRAGGDPATALTVRYAVGGAAAGVRLASLGGTVTIPAGSTKAKIKVWALDDGVPEPDQPVKIKLEAGENYTVGSPAKVKLAVADPAR